MVGTTARHSDMFVSWASLYHVSLTWASRKTARAILVPQFPLILIIESLICQNIYIIECMYIIDLEIANKYLSIYLSISPVCPLTIGSCA